ncbi:hypothetical protein AADZ90_021905 [Aestuariibius sp. 2305UL40-4]|uniref:hypothetical protein n=1 Tax=Aestuariibius violaceus TaxID=3234132 RepID=UPI00398EC168
MKEDGMNFYSNISRLEYSVYFVVFLCILAAVAAHSLSFLKLELFALFSQLSDTVVLALSLFCPLAIMFSIVLSSFSLDKPGLGKLIAPPLRVKSDLLVSKISFVLFWTGIIVFIALRFIILPNRI